MERDARAQEERDAILDVPSRRPESPLMVRRMKRRSVMMKHNLRVLTAESSRHERVHACQREFSRIRESPRLLGRC